MPVRYELSVPSPSSHLVEVAVTLSGVRDVAPLELTMAAWSPGSYLIRDYARHVQDVRADGAAAVGKLDKQTWRVDAAGADEVTVRYAVYGRALTVRTNHIDDTHAFLHGPATYLFAPALADESCTVVVSAPEGWNTYTGLAGGPVEFAAADVDELLDAPLHIAPGRALEFEAAGKPARLVLWNDFEAGVATVDELIADTAKVMDTHAARFGGTAPYDRYTFMLMLAPNAYGGLEHRNSSANLNSPFAFATRKSYEELLELLSHEYFHVWNGKRIRPAALGPFDYSTEAYTRSLWVQEGITSYIDRYTLRRAGVQGVEQYLEKLAEEWGKLQAIPGRRLHSVEDASFDAWIKLYKPDESNVNTTVSYYLKGGFVAMALDRAIRAAGDKTIDDALRRLWERYGEAPRGYEDADVQGEIEAAAGTDLGAVFDRCVRGTDDPDIAALLADAGLTLEGGYDPPPPEGRTPVWLGVMFRDGRTLRAVLDGGPAADGGLAPGDELIAIDGYQVGSDADVRRRLAARLPGETIEAAVFRHGRLRTVSVTLTAAPPNRYQIRTAENPSPEQKAYFESWLGQPYPSEPLDVAATVSTWC